MTEKWHPSEGRTPEDEATEGGSEERRQHHLVPSLSHSKRSTRVNANHLLNFQPRTVGSSNQTGSWSRDREEHAGRSTASRRRKGGSTRVQPYDRKKFLQANFRFLVSDTVDISTYEADADLMLDWEDVIAVVMLSSAPIHCPITLEAPWCPQITPCGHVFSFQAIIAHMISHGGPELRVSSPCPLCTTLVAARELRPVHVRYVNEPKVGSTMTFQLLTRRWNSIIADAVDGNIIGATNEGKTDSEGSAKVVEATAWRHKSSTGGHSGDENDNEQDKAADYFATRDYLLPRYSKFKIMVDPMPLWISEAEHLAKKAATLLAEGGLEANYEVPPLLAAIQTLASKAKSWSERRIRNELTNLNDDEAGNRPMFEIAEASEKAGKDAKQTILGAAESATLNAERELREKQHSAKFHEAFPALSRQQGSFPFEDPGENALELVRTGDEYYETVDMSASSKSLPACKSSSAEASKEEVVYLYQSVDGQWTFLCPLNMRMLFSHFGSYDACPVKIRAQVLEIEEKEQTLHVRKKFRSIAHVPVTARFKTVEVDLSHALPKESLDAFSQDLAQRAKRRAKQAQQEARERAIEASRVLAAARLEEDQAPSIEELASMPLPSASRDKEHDPGKRLLDEFKGNGESAHESLASLSSEAVPSGAVPIPNTSFATIARLGFAATGPVLGESPPTFGHSPGTSNSVWGKRSPTTMGNWASRSEERGRDRPRAQSQESQTLTDSSAPPPSTRKKSGKTLLLSSSHRKY